MVVGFVYAAAGWWAERTWQSLWALAAILGPWLAIVGGIVLRNALVHAYPLVGVAIMGGLVGYGARHRGRANRTVAAALSLYVVIVVAGGVIGMPNWVAVTTLHPADPTSAAVDDAVFYASEPMRGSSSLPVPSAFAGRVVVLDLWTTTCTACFAQFPKLDELSDQYANDPRVDVVAVNLTVSSDEPGKAETMLGRFNYGFRSLYADLSFDEAREIYGFRGVPTVVVYDRDGDLAFVGSPEYNPVVFVNNLRREIEAALSDA
ncbi:MAG: TlpA disulfide reductase family protein [Bacteroidota bacterium]